MFTSKSSYCEFKFGESGHVDEADLLSTRPVLEAHFVEPHGLVERAFRLGLVVWDTICETMPATWRKVKYNSHSTCISISSTRSRENVSAFFMI